MGLATMATLSVLAGLLSPLIIVRGQSFMAVSVSHATVLGLSLSFILLSPDNHHGIYLLTSAVTLGLSLPLAAVGLRRNLPFDSLIGVFFSVSMGLGILLFHLAGDGGDMHFVEYLFGDLALVGPVDVIVALVNLLIVALAILPFLKEWVYDSIGPESASVSGRRTALFHYGFIVLLTLSVISSLKAVGIILVNTMFLIPGIFALRMARGIGGVFLSSVLFSLVSGVCGFALSAGWQTPSGATTAMVQFTLLVLSFALGRGQRSPGR